MFSEKFSATAGSTKEIAGLKKKKLKNNCDDDTNIVKPRMSDFSHGELKVYTYEVFGNMYRLIWARRLLLVCFEGLGSHSHRVFSRFVRGSREISLMPSLHRASTDALINQ